MRFRKGGAQGAKSLWPLLLVLALVAVPIAGLASAATAFGPWMLKVGWAEQRAEMLSSRSQPFTSAFDRSDGSVAIWFPSERPHPFVHARDMLIAVGRLENASNGTEFRHTVPDDWRNKGVPIKLDSVETSLPDWLQRLPPMRPIVPTCTLDVSVMASGWPCECMWAWGATEYNPGAHGSVQVLDGGIEFSDWSVIGYFPTIPIAQGWIVNTFVWWVVAFAAVVGVALVLRKLRGMLRVRRGRCPLCNYDCQGNEHAGTCPECGLAGQ